MCGRIVRRNLDPAAEEHHGFLVIQVVREFKCANAEITRRFLPGEGLVWN
jgi:hypothetical protein